jgi:hypothetical protein
MRNYGVGTAVATAALLVWAAVVIFVSGAL